ncbi:ATP-binding cassette transporter YOR1 [Sugiyamaella lignohabitans]|uniref:ATP-binding cassette transporter YOR1 n=1 Tax=Sugiyamaella lignohabitans TaxID=796027 RepID=A0A161HH60_9ASCO|nr:ATP-binding cassette transporter YOR1 [Sugiyamaella lignohabitans]ANB11357.1 ATP-binding cassette transporter YOR1 [Sugiyamaella lignohabitans]
MPLPRFSVLRALNSTFFYQWWSAGAFKIISDCAQAFTPLLSKKLIAFTMVREVDSSVSVGKGVGYAIGIVLLFMVNSFFLNVFFFRAMMTGAQARSVLSQAIYEKSLRLSGKARIHYTNGILTNLMSTDCHRIDFALQWLHFAWTFPVSIVICIVIVLTNIGASGLVGFALLFVCFFIVTYMAQVLGKIRKKVNKITDTRVSIMREILQAMKIIKFYSWEEAYEEKVAEVRRDEMHRIKIMHTARNLLNALFVSAPTLAGLVSFVTLSSTGGHLNPAAVFSSLTTFNITRMPLMFLPLAIMAGYDSFLAVNRIQDLLSAGEAEFYIEYNVDQDDAIAVKNGSFIWEKDDAKKEGDDSESDGDSTSADKYHAKSQPSKADEDETNALTPAESINAQARSVQDVPAPGVVEPIDHLTESANAVSDSEVEQFNGFSGLDLTVANGEFVIVTGTIGSGKSSLLAAIAGGMRKLDGSVTLNGQLAFCGQQWVQNATVRDNITFGKPFDEEWYKEVIYACSLNRDLEILPAGDQTEVGERGITISGGQKARINLARAVYWNADIILLDDVLSAVDAHVGKHIIDHCICGLLKNKTRMLATHQLSMLQYADRVIFLDNTGKTYSGSVDYLKETVPEFNNLLTYGHQSESDDDIPAEEEEEEAKEHVDKEALEIKKIASKDPKTLSEDEKKKLGVLMQAEEKASDAVPLKTYMAFFKLGGGSISYAILPLLLSAMILSTFCQLFTNTWLSFWTGNKFPGRTEPFYIGIFVMFGILSAVFSFLFFFAITHIINLTSLTLHVQGVNRVLHAPMSFFDTSPLGRILNRFTKDTDTVDNEMSDQSRLLLMSVSSVGGAFILVIIYLPYFAIALVGLMFFFFAAAKFYRASAREIKRMESLGRSVLFSHFGETLSGTSTIKAYNNQEIFIRKSEKAIDKMNAPYYLTIANQRWLALRLDLVGAGLTLVTTMLCVTGQFSISPSSVGLVLSSLLQTINMMSMIVRQLASVENNMNSVERVHHYAYELPTEAPFHIEATRPDPSWPKEGRIDFKNMTMAYQPGLPPVLKNINLNINGGEKIGICGRTGAGKSTIMVALYRLAEMSGGSIDIDGVDISTLGLNELRMKLSIIPQDPVLFQGTIRSNIDPFGTCTDVELWDALRRSWLVESKDLELLKQGSLSMDKVKFHLDSVVDDEGTNFSLGERQLLALARALVRKSQILILDEATSSVDFQTDHRIQTTIVNEFSHCTILCIAHRLNTILAYDRILVLEQGEVAEFDDPVTLMNIKGGAFQSMCERSGISMDDVLEQQAARKNQQ